MNGIGNSILVVDLRETGTVLTGATAKAAGEQPTLHFDQLMAIEAPRRSGTDAFVDIFNVDGTRAGACGNGTRCVAWTMLRNSPRTDLLVETPGGTLACRRLGSRRFSVDMGAPHLDWQEIPLLEPVVDTAAVAMTDPPAAALARFSAVGMGNPHAVFFVADPTSIDLARLGPLLEHDPIFPDRANISFVRIVSRTHLRLRVWERGAGATLACGSAACAALVAGVRAGLTERQAQVSLPGGDLDIVWRTADQHVIMTGDVELEHEGVLPREVLDAGR